MNVAESFTRLLFLFQMRPYLYPPSFNLKHLSPPYYVKMQPPQSLPARRQSASKPPPMIPAGMAVRSAHTKYPIPPSIQQQQQHQPYYRISSPAPSPKTVLPGDTPRSNNSSLSSRPSPALSSGSTELRDSTRVNIRHVRQDSSRWEEKLKTPREEFIPPVRVQDPVEAQFEHLLVSAQHEPSR